MKLDTLVLVAVAVPTAMAASAWLAPLVLAAAAAPIALLALLPGALVGHVTWAALEKLLTSAEDGRYHRIVK